MHTTSSGRRSLQVQRVRKCTIELNVRPNMMGLCCNGSTNVRFGFWVPKSVSTSVGEFAFALAINCVRISFDRRYSRARKRRSVFAAFLVWRRSPAVPMKVESERTALRHVASVLALVALLVVPRVASEFHLFQ